MKRFILSWCLLIHFHVNNLNSCMFWILFSLSTLRKNVLKLLSSLHSFLNILLHPDVEKVHWGVSYLFYDYVVNIFSNWKDFSDQKNLHFKIFKKVLSLKFSALRECSFDQWLLWLRCIGGIFSTKKGQM